MSEPFKICPTCGTPHVPENLSLIILFRCEKDRAEFKEVFAEVMPSAKTYNVPEFDPKDIS